MPLLFYELATSFTRREKISTQRTVQRAS